MKLILLLYHNQTSHLSHHRNCKLFLLRDRTTCVDSTAVLAVQLLINSTVWQRVQVPHAWRKIFHNLLGVKWKQWQQVCRNFPFTWKMLNVHLNTLCTSLCAPLCALRIPFPACAPPTTAPCNADISWLLTAPVGQKPPACWRVASWKSCRRELLTYAWTNLNVAGSPPAGCSRGAVSTQQKCSRSFLYTFVYVCVCVRVFVLLLHLFAFHFNLISSAHFHANKALLNVSARWCELIWKQLADGQMQKRGLEVNTIYVAWTAGHNHHWHINSLIEQFFFFINCLSY